MKEFGLVLGPIKEARMLTTFFNLNNNNIILTSFQT